MKPYMNETSLLRETLRCYFPWHGARLSFPAQFLIALYRVKTVNLTEIATGFVGPTQVDSHYKRLQRFFRDALDTETFAQAVVLLMAFPQLWVLCFDRTQWQFG